MLPSCTVRRWGFWTWPRVRVQPWQSWRCLCSARPVPGSVHWLTSSVPRYVVTVSPVCSLQGSLSSAELRSLERAPSHPPHVGLPGAPLFPVQEEVHGKRGTSTRAACPSQTCQLCPSRRPHDPCFMLSSMRLIGCLTLFLVPLSSGEVAVRSISFGYRSALGSACTCGVLVPFMQHERLFLSGGLCLLFQRLAGPLRVCSLYFPLVPARLQDPDRLPSERAGQ